MSTGTDDVSVKFGADGNALAGQLADISTTLNNHFKGMSGALSEFQTQTSKVANALQYLAGGAVVGLIGSSLSKIVNQFTDFSDQLQKVQVRTGLSGEELQKLQFAAKMSDISTEQLTFGLTRLARSMEEAKKPSSEMRKTFDDIGISSSDLKTLKVDEVLGKVADRFKTMGDATQRTAEAMQIFGRSGASLIPFLVQGADGIDTLKKKAAELGIVFNDDLIAQGANLDNEMKQLSAQSTALSYSIGSALIPTTTALVKALQQASTSTIEWAVIIKGAVGGVAAIFIGLKLSIEIAFTAIKATISTFVDSIVLVGQIVDLAFTGDWGRIKKVWDDGLTGLSKTVETAKDSIFRDARASQEALLTLFSTPPPAPKLSKGGEDKAGSSALLEEFKLELAEKKASASAFVEFSKAEEARFWQSKLSEFTKGSSAYMEVLKEMHTAQRAADKKAFDEKIKLQVDYMERERTGGIERVQLASNIARDVGKAYGLQSDQYRQAMKKVEETAQQHTAAMIALDNEIAVAHRDHALAMVEFDATVTAALDLEETSKAVDRVIREVNFEEQKYAIKRDALVKAMLLDTQETLEHQKHLSELAALDDAYATSVAAGANKLKAAKIQDDNAIKASWAGVVGSMSTSLAASIKGMIAGTTTLTGAIKNMGSSILSAMVDLGVQMVAKWIFTQLALTGVSATQAVARIGIYAMESAAAVYAWWARLNPIVAGVLAVAAAATVYGFAKNIISGGSNNAGAGGAASAPSVGGADATASGTSGTQPAQAAPVYNIYVQGDLVDHTELARKLRLPTQYLSNIDTV